MIPLLEFIAGWFALKEEVEPEPQTAYMTIVIETIPADTPDADAADTSTHSEHHAHGTL